MTKQLMSVRQQITRKSHLRASTPSSARRAGHLRALRAVLGLARKALDRPLQAVAALGAPVAALGARALELFRAEPGVRYVLGTPEPEHALALGISERTGGPRVRRADLFVGARRRRRGRGHLQGEGPASRVCLLASPCCNCEDFGFPKTPRARFFVESGASIIATRTPLSARATPKTPTPRFAWRTAAAIAPGLGWVSSLWLWRSGALSAAPAFIMAFNCAVRAQGSRLSFAGGLIYASRRGCNTRASVEMSNVYLPH